MEQQQWWGVKFKWNKEIGVKLIYTMASIPMARSSPVAIFYNDTYARDVSVWYSKQKKTKAHEHQCMRPDKDSIERKEGT